MTNYEVILISKMTQVNLPNLLVTDDKTIRLLWMMVTQQRKNRELDKLETRNNCH